MKYSAMLIATYSSKRTKANNRGDILKVFSVKQGENVNDGKETTTYYDQHGLPTIKDLRKQNGGSG